MIKFILATFFFSHIYAFISKTMGQEYQVMDANELFEIIEQSEIIEEFQLDENEAFVYRLANNKWAIIPNIGNEGILFHTKLAYDKMLATMQFPVKDDNSIFVKHRETLCDVEKHVDDYIQELENLLGVRAPSTENVKELSEFSTKVNEYLKLNGNSKITIPLGIYLCEFLRIKIMGRWKAEKIYVLNPYWVPDITDKKNRQYSTWSLMYEHLEKQNFSMEKFIERAKIPVRASKYL
jgi:hypothetical protein